jgi:histidinol phosphatase-like PHP family hydrolase
MRYVPDHDLHIHSHLSPCSADDRQSPAAILSYGLTAGFSLLCVTDHCWPQTPLSLLRSHQPLPQSKKCKFLFGAEVDMDKTDTLSVSPADIETLDFAVISTDHLNLRGYSIDPAVTPGDALSRKTRYKERLHTMLAMDLPFHKTGLAHFTAELVCGDEPIRCLTLFSDAELIDIFTKVRDRGMGVELNFVPDRYKPDDLREVLRPYFIAKNLGCKFYFASDAHHPEGFCGVVKRKMEPIIDLLDLTEEDKFPFVKEMIAGMNG